MMMKDIISNQLKEHKPIIINYGKGIITNEDVKEKAYYDEKEQKYVSETGIWSNKLLRQILNNEVEDVKIEVGE